jgi:hypothetical protein
MASVFGVLVVYIFIVFFRIDNGRMVDRRKKKQKTNAIRPESRKNKLPEARKIREILSPFRKR